MNPNQQGRVVRRFYLEPLGCVKNQVDAETFMAQLGRAGWAAAASPEEADLLIVNTCGFIRSATQESIDTILAFRKRYPDKKLLVTGCLALRYGSALREEMTEADAVFTGEGGQSIVSASQALFAEDAEDAEDAEEKSGEGREEPPPGERPLLSLPGSAYVKIAEGCENRCAFCAIPDIRGPLRSRTGEDILAECRTLLERGVKELCLIAQDTASYGADFRAGAQSALPDLLRRLSALPGEFWVRLLYIHPDNFPRGILPIMQDDKRFLPYFDLPFQHAAEGVLRAMNRRGSAQSYLDLIQEIRETFGGKDGEAVIRSTFLVGFPGESGADFDRLLDFQEQAKIDWAGVFCFSREEGTPACGMSGRVPRKLAQERKRTLEVLQESISGERAARFVGRTLTALVEEDKSREGDTLYLGRLYCHAPEVDGALVLISDSPLQEGTFVTCKVTSRAGIDLISSA